MICEFGLVIALEMGGRLECNMQELNERCGYHLEYGRERFDCVEVFQDEALGGDDTYGVFVYEVEVYYNQRYLKKVKLITSKATVLI